MKKLAVLLSLLVISFSVFGVNFMPIVLFSHNGVDTDSVLCQEVFTVKDLTFNLGINFKRIGADIGYITPLLMKGIELHGGVYFDWKDIAKKDLTPKFSLGVSLRW